MKVYTIYLNDDRGWTSDKVDGFYCEVKNVFEEETFASEPPEENEFNKNIEKLNANESYKVIIGESEIEIKCKDMPEEVFRNLDEFTGW